MVDCRRSADRNQEAHLCSASCRGPAGGRQGQWRRRGGVQGGEASGRDAAHTMNTSDGAGESEWMPGSSARSRRTRIPASLLHQGSQRFEFQRASDC